MFRIIHWVIIIAWIASIIGGVNAGTLDYNEQHGDYWNLALRAGTLKEKAAYIDKFVESLEDCSMKGEYDALWQKTPKNSFDYNFALLKKLQGRFNEIKDLDVKSSEYNWAIYQITDQEQEGSGIAKVIKGCWWKQNHFLLWNMMLIFNILALGILIMVKFIIWMEF